MGDPLHLNEFPLSLDERGQAEAAFAELVPAEQWAAYTPVLAGALERGLRFALGGGIAFSLYSGMLRNTKDLDIFILPPDQESFLALMCAAGFDEYTAVPYDPTWSYRGEHQGFILDVLWRMLNDRMALDAGWVSRGWKLRLRGLELRLLPPEELIWTKLYILHRDRCDWPDLLILLNALGPRLDWDYLLQRVGADAPLLGGLLSTFRWLCPGRAKDLPPWLWPRLGLQAAGEADGPPVERRRVTLLSDKDWFPV